MKWQWPGQPDRSRSCRGWSEGCQAFLPLAPDTQSPGQRQGQCDTSPPHPSPRHLPVSKQVLPLVLACAAATTQESPLVRQVGGGTLSHGVRQEAV